MERMGAEGSRWSCSYPRTAPGEEGARRGGHGHGAATVPEQVGRGQGAGGEELGRASESSHMREIALLLFVAIIQCTQYTKTITVHLHDFSKGGHPF